ncbi:uncharacterized protein YALI1_F09161g [Yarrowia lipolytica]|uniref:Uncharacterized protein n=1 Tax=Yarrowia lipolytica TaxID=4952 RepID=A0A1D8NM77_YARLL|nr:hypothetical protein YALI1_F09161g [Yarrowia lipolytica]
MSSVEWFGCCPVIRTSLYSVTLTGAIARALVLWQQIQAQHTVGISQCGVAHLSHHRHQTSWAGPTQLAHRVPFREVGDETLRRLVGTDYIPAI